MFEVLRQEAVYDGIVNTSAAKRGSICYKSGVDANGITMLDIAKSSATSAIAMYPVNKIPYRDDLADDTASINKFVKGERCIYYEGGVFASDQFRMTGSRGNYTGTTPPTGYPTDTSNYTLYTGAPVPLYTCTNSSYYGCVQTTCLGIMSVAQAAKNHNFEVITILNATPSAGIYTADATIIYKVKHSRIGVDVKQ
jgi:hypothetical protein